MVVDVKPKLFAICILILALSNLVHSTYTLLPNNSTNKAYTTPVDGTTNSSPDNVTITFLPNSYSYINTSDNTYATSTAREPIGIACTSTGTATCTKYVECIGDGSCRHSTCNFACPTAGNATNTSNTCTAGATWPAQCVCSGGYCPSTSGNIDGTCTISGSCSYICNSGYYDSDGNDANGCESTSTYLRYAFQRYTFNLSSYLWSGITELKLCWEGKYNTTGGANSSTLAWYNSNTAAWTPWQSLPYNSENPYCITFTPANKSYVYNSTGTWVQFAVMGSQVKSGHTLTIYADYAYLNVTYGMGITQNGPPDGSINASRTINFTYTPTGYESPISNCSIWDNSTGAWARLKTNGSQIINNTVNNITYTYSRDYSQLKWAVECCNSAGSCNMTGNWTLRIDSTPPTFYPSSVGASNNNPLPGASVNFFSQWNDNINLSKYWFSWNASGANCDNWSSDTPADFQAANWTNTTKTIPDSCVGKTVGYIFAANDTAKNINQTDMKTFTVTPPALCTSCFNTSATVTIRNTQGIVVNNAPMVCTFINYIRTGTDTPLTCGGISPYNYNNITSSANMSNFSCNYTFPKNYSVEGDWNATIQFVHNSGYNAFDATIQSPGLNSTDCTGPLTCRTDPQCRSGGGETLNLTLYNISWDARQGDCEGNGDVWFSNVNTSVVPAECAGNPGQACCCGDDGTNDNFYYYNATSKECRYCNNGVSNLSDETSRKCSDAACSSRGWNQTLCVDLTQKAEPESSVGGICFGINIKFICNYTDGYGTPLNDSFVNVTIDSQVHQINELTFDNTLKVYYYNTSDLAAGSHQWNCSAWKPGYNSKKLDPSDYNISEPSNVTLAVDTDPHSPGFYNSSVTFIADYRNASDNAPITDATCTLYMRQTPYLAQLNGTVYTVNMTDLLYGMNDWEFVCNRSCFKTGRNSSTYYIQFPADFQPPSITFEDPAYSINSNTVYHKLVKGAPSVEGLATRIVSGKIGNIWIYSMVIKPAVENPTCAQISNLDKSAILFVKNSSLIANASSCINISQFVGLIFEDDACITNAVDCADKLTLVPYLFGLNNSVYSNIPNSTYVLLNGEYKQLQNITKLREFYLNGYYRESKFAPSFLMRLYGQFTPSQYGIESFVKIDQFAAPKTSIDYYYFNTSVNPTRYKIKGMPNCENISICSTAQSHFYLDKEIAVANSSGTYTHLTIYGAERLAIGYAPTPSCGDGNCDLGENYMSCPTDCKSSSYCGDGMCSAGEDCSNCLLDCGCTGTYHCTDCSGTYMCVGPLGCLL